MQDRIRPARAVHGASPRQGTLLRNNSNFPSRQSPLRSIEELIEHPERSPDASIFAYSPSHRSGSQNGSTINSAVSAQAKAQDAEIAKLLAENLELYNGHKYFSSIGETLVDCDPDLVPKPLFFDPDDRQILLPRRSASNIPQDRNQECPLILPEVGPSITPTTRYERSLGSDPQNGVPATPLPRSAGKQQRSARRSLSSPSKPNWHDLSLHERECIKRGTIESEHLQDPHQEATNGSDAILPGSRTGSIGRLSGLSPAKKLPKSPRALLFAPPPRANDDDSIGVHHDTGAIKDRTIFNHPALPRSTVWKSRHEVSKSTSDATTDPFTAEYRVPGGTGPRGDSFITFPKAFPRDMIKVMLTDMAKEGWFEPGDLWIYFRLVKTTKEDIYLNKELKLCKIRHDGVLTIAVPKGPLKKIPEVQHIDRKPVPPAHSRLGAPFPDSPTLPSSSINSTILLRSIRSPRRSPTMAQSGLNSSVEQPSTPKSEVTLDEAMSIISIDDSILTPRRNSNSTELARSASVRSTPTYGPRPQPPKRRASGSIQSNEAAEVEIKILQDLERRIFELDGRVSGTRRYEFGSNVWKQIHCLRGNRDLGTLWDMRQECARGWKKSARR